FVMHVVVQRVCQVIRSWTVKNVAKLSTKNALVLKLQLHKPKIHVSYSFVMIAKTA
ncbi:hypothetical protein WUBG_16402, partial [Wuchereria bancrofti]